MDQPIARVRVTHLNGRGEVSSDHVLAAPCVEVLFSFTTGLTGNVTYEGKVWALIDTGADMNLIDVALIPQHATRNAAIETRGISGATSATVYLADLSLVGSGTALTTQVLEWHQRAGAPYRVILGRHFLRHTRFIYDRMNGITALDLFKGNQPARASGVQR